MAATAPALDRTSAEYYNKLVRDHHLELKKNIFLKNFVEKEYCDWPKDSGEDKLTEAAAHLAAANVEFDAQCTRLSESMSTIPASLDVADVRAQYDKAVRAEKKIADHAVAMADYRQRFVDAKLDYVAPNAIRARIAQIVASTLALKTKTPVDERPSATNEDVGEMTAMMRDVCAKNAAFTSPDGDETPVIVSSSVVAVARRIQTVLGLDKVRHVEERCVDAEAVSVWIVDVLGVEATLTTTATVLVSTDCRCPTRDVAGMPLEHGIRAVSNDIALNVQLLEPLKGRHVVVAQWLTRSCRYALDYDYDARRLKWLTAKGVEVLIAVDDELNLSVVDVSTDKHVVVHDNGDAVEFFECIAKQL